MLFVTVFFVQGRTVLSLEYGVAENVKTPSVTGEIVVALESSALETFGATEKQKPNDKIKIGKTTRKLRRCFVKLFFIIKNILA